MLLNIPYVQRQATAMIERELSRVLQTELSIGHVNLGFLNRIIIDDVLVHDRQGEEMLKVSRFSVKFEISQFFKRKISISTAQLFGFNVQLYKATASAEPNFQFVLDTFAPKNRPPRAFDLDLRVNSLLIRRGKMSYHVLDAPVTPGRFNPQHIQLANVKATMSVKALRRDSIHASIKRMSFDESAGFQLDKLRLKVVADRQRMSIDEFVVQLPQSTLQLDTIRVSYPDGLSTWTHGLKKIRFSASTAPSTRIVLSDLSSFVPVLSRFHDPVGLQFKVNGSLDQLTCQVLKVSSATDFEVLARDISFNDITRSGDAFVYGNRFRVYVNPQGMRYLFRNLHLNKGTVPPVVQHMGVVSFNGEVSGYLNDLVAYGLFRTDLGNFNSDLKFHYNKALHQLGYSGGLGTDGFDMGGLMPDNRLGDIAFSLKVNGRHTPGRYPTISLKGDVSAFEYSDYLYQNLSINGTYKRGGFYGKLSIDDPNISLMADGLVNTVAKVPTFDFIAKVNHFRPHDLHLTPRYESAVFKTNLSAKFKGLTLDKAVGQIAIDSFQFVSPAKSYFLDRFEVVSAQERRTKRLDVTSNFFNARLEGNYSYKTLPQSLMNIVHTYLPALTTGQKIRPASNTFRFEAQLTDTRLFTDVLELPFSVFGTRSTVEGYVDDTQRTLSLQAYLPRVQVQKHYLESVLLGCDNLDGNLESKVRLTKITPKGALTLSLQADAAGDSLRTVVNWGNNTVTTYSGKFAASAHFLPRAVREPFKMNVDIHPTSVILGDSLWHVHPSAVQIDSGKVAVRNFLFSSNSRHVAVNGLVSPVPTDSLFIDLDEINVGYIFDMANISHIVNFEGDATGKAYAAGLLRAPNLQTNLHISRFSLNKSLLGDMDIYGSWDNAKRAIYLDADIREDTLARTFVKGHIYPIKPESGLDLHIDAHHLNVGFLQHYMQNIASEVNGRASGHVHFNGRFKELELRGDVAADARMKFDILGTPFQIKDSIHLIPEGIDFRNALVMDMEQHRGRLDGYLRYKHFKNIRYRFGVNTDNILVMDTKESPDMPFYGKVYGTGTALIAGNADDGLDVNVSMRSCPNSFFTYITEGISSATSSQFITFVDKTPKREVTTDAPISFNPFDVVHAEESTSSVPINLNLNVETTPDATIRIVMDPAAGDNITARGSGNLQVNFSNKTDGVNMYGKYNIQQGTYKFSLQDIIRKDFIIQNGSQITFNGDPLNATMDIQAHYTVPSASLSDLIPDAHSIVKQPNVRVNCLMNLTGDLLQPNIKLGVELPNEREEVQALVRNYISTDEQMNLQILYLLGIGKFYMENTAGTDLNSSDMMSSVLSSTLSGQLNTMLSQIIDNNNWNIGTSLSTGEKGWTDVEVEGMLSGQLLNNRLIINGNFGYRDNPMANTNFIGDFEAEWLITRSGDLRFKAYNETNDRYYTKTNLTTQGAGLIYKKNFDKWSELFFWNQWKTRLAEKRRLRAQKKLLKAQSETLDQSDDQNKQHIENNK